MAPTFEYVDTPEHSCHVRPDELDQLVTQLEALQSPCLHVRRFRQYDGSQAYALTIAGKARRPEASPPKRRLFVSRPHAHEPAGVAAQLELAKALLGWGDYCGRCVEWRDWALGGFLVTLVPDANPSGSRRAPVKFWDGSRMPNDQFKLWMFGESGETPGERFPRVPSWDAREVAAPRLLGICYERIDEHRYVEPNRDHRSTFFRSFFELDAVHRYEVFLDLHQTEFENAPHNCMVNVSVSDAPDPRAIAAANLSLAEAIHARWRREGATPRAAPNANVYSGSIQKEYLARAWGTIGSRLPHVVTEVQNNSPRTPWPLQTRLQLAAILETMEWMARQGEIPRLSPHIRPAKKV